MRAPGSLVARAAAVLLLGVTAACGSASTPTGPPTLSWYVAPDRLDAEALAQTCTDEAAGAYTIAVKPLPRDATARHDLLVRRMLSRSSGIDLLSLDSAFTAELAAGGFLAPVPTELVDRLSTGIAPPALAAATYGGKLVVAPWWMDPQVLWYRGNVAERAGLDTSEPISWDDLVAGAQRIGVTVQIEDRDGSGLATWVNALVAGAGGDLVTGEGRDAKVGLSTDAGRAAASIVELAAGDDVVPGPSKDALTAFAAADGGFLVAPSSVIVDPALTTVAADMVSAPYPVIDDASVAPLAGIGLAVPADAARTSLSYDAVSCLTSPDVLTVLMTTGRHSASRLATYDDAAVKAAFPDGKAIRKAVTTGRIVPVTPYWSRVVAAIDETWLPITDVSQDRTPDESQEAVTAAVRGTLR